MEHGFNPAFIMGSQMKEPSVDDFADHDVSLNPDLI